MGRFLTGKIGFDDIPVLVEQALRQISVVREPALADILAADQLARAAVRN